jgi:hypothetical protein
MVPRVTSPPLPVYHAVCGHVKERPVIYGVFDGADERMPARGTECEARQLHGVAHAIGRSLRGIGAAARRRPGFLLSVAASLVALDVVLPLLVLTVTRGPWTYAAVNPWLKKLPEYLGSAAPLSQKIDFLSRVAVFWFSRDGAYGAPEWGFAVDTMDLARFGAMGLLVGTYFALLVERRAARAGGWGPASRRTGLAGACASVLGVSTSPCSVMGCGAPVMPVLSLAFVGLSSGTVALLSGASRIVILAVLALMLAGVGWLGWHLDRALERRSGHGDG